MKIIKKGKKNNILNRNNIKLLPNIQLIQKKKKINHFHKKILIIY